MSKSVEEQYKNIKLSKMHDCIDGKQRLMLTPVRDIGDGSDRNQHWVQSGDEYCPYCQNELRQAQRNKLRSNPNE